MPVADEVGLDPRHLAGDALGSEPATLDDRPDRLDRDPRPRRGALGPGVVNGAAVRLRRREAERSTLGRAHFERPPGRDRPRAGPASFSGTSVPPAPPIPGSTTSAGSALASSGFGFNASTSRGAALLPRASTVTSAPGAETSRAGGPAKSSGAPAGAR